MADDCLTFRQFPRAGGWHEQSDFEMEAMRVALRTLEVCRKQSQGKAWDLDDADWIAWIESD